VANRTLFLTESAPRSGMRLGRHVNHDPRSRAFPHPTDLTAASKSVEWKRHSPIFDQGDIGSCTGNAASGLVATDSKYRNGRNDCSERDALVIYERATQIDSFDGSYPPDDTGSDGLSVMKVLKEQGYVKSYQHAFTFAAMATALQERPVIVGIQWQNDMYSPDENGVVRWSGGVVGGHEFVVRGLDAVKQLVICDNSWGDSWGVAGSFKVPYADFTKALAADGDVTIPRWWNE